MNFPSILRTELRRVDIEAKYKYASTVAKLRSHISLSAIIHRWVWYAAGIKSYYEALQTIRCPSSVDHPGHSSQTVIEILIPPSPFLSSISQLVSAWSTRNSAFLCLTHDICKRRSDKSFTEAAQHSGTTSWLNHIPSIKPSTFLYYFLNSPSFKGTILRHTAFSFYIHTFEEWIHSSTVSSNLFP